MRKILAVATKELRQIVRDPLSLLMLLGFPAFMLVIFGYAISFDVEDVALGVWDRDLSLQSRRLVDTFVNSGRFNLVASPTQGGEVDALLESGRVRLVLVIPEGFGRDLAAGRAEAPAAAQLLLDGADSNTATTVLGYASSIVAAANASLRAGALEASGLEGVLKAAIKYEPRVWYNPELVSSHFLIPGLMGFILMLTAVLSTALSLVREAERGTLEQLRVAPLGPVQILLGKTLPYLGIALMAMVIILVAARLLFGVEVKGPYLDLFVVTLLYLLGGFGFGLLVSTLADSQAVAFQIGITASLLPTLLLSGFLFPLRNMPQALQVLSLAVPARYYLMTLRGIILKGADLEPYWQQVVALVVYTVVVLTLASVRFARKGT